MSSGMVEFGFGQNDAGVGDKGSRFKPVGGQVYRVSFASWPLKADGTLNLDAVSPLFLGGPRCWVDNVGNVLNPSPEVEKLSKDPTKTAYGTLLVIWPTDSEGNLDKAKIARGDMPRIMPWTFAGDKYPLLKTCHSNFPLGKFDVLMSCEASQYKRLSFASCNSGLLRSILDNPKQTEWAAKLTESIIKKMPLVAAEIGREMTIEQVRAKLGGAPSPNQNNGGNGASFGGVAQQVGSSASDIDDLLDGMLETPPVA